MSKIPFWTLKAGALAAKGFFATFPERQVFVLGNQKSGTTAVAGLLALATAKSVALDFYREEKVPSYPRVLSRETGFDEFIRRNRWEFTREIVKEPNLTHFYTELRHTFQGASFVFVARNPVDNIRSILSRLNLPGDSEQNDPTWDRKLTPAWRIILGLTKPQKQRMHYIDSLAWRWRGMARVYLDHREDFSLIRYEDFVRAKVLAIERLAAALQLSVHRDISTHVDLPFQPRGKYVGQEAFFGPNNLRRIQEICNETRTELECRA